MSVISILIFASSWAHAKKCEPHLLMAMAGVIQVGKATNLDAAKQEAEKISKAFVVNKDRIQKHIARAQ